MRNSGVILAETDDQGLTKNSFKSTRRRELLAFAALAFGIWPLVAVAVVGGYGFLVWMWQIAFGPPGPPAGGVS